MFTNQIMNFKVFIEQRHSFCRRSAVSAAAWALCKAGFHVNGDCDVCSFISALTTQSRRTHPVHTHALCKHLRTSLTVTRDCLRHVIHVSVSTCEVGRNELTPSASYCNVHKWFHPLEVYVPRSMPNHKRGALRAPCFHHVLSIRVGYVRVCFLI